MMFFHMPQIFFFSEIINMQPKDWRSGSFQLFRTDNWLNYEVAHTCAEGCK